MDETPFIEPSMSVALGVDAFVRVVVASSPTGMIGIGGARWIFCGSSAVDRCASECKLTLHMPQKPILVGFTTLLIPRK